MLTEREILAIFTEIQLTCIIQYEMLRWVSVRHQQASRAGAKKCQRSVQWKGSEPSEWAHQAGSCAMWWGEDINTNK